MPRLPLTLLLACLTLVGCTGDKGKELLETAQLEEKQHNVAHAAQLYREIIRKFPNTEYARSAAERLAAMGQSKQ